VPQAIVAYSPEGKIHVVNRRAEALFGYRREELLNRGVEELIPERHRELHATRRREFFAHPRRRSAGSLPDLAGRRKDGREFPLEASVQIVETASGPLALAVLSDAAPRQRAEAELARVKAELARCNAELEQFLYIASHDLQEPLRMISSYLQLLERRYGGRVGQDGAEFIHYAVDGAARMKRLLQDLLRVARAGTQSADLHPVQAADLLAGAMTNLRAALQETGAAITWDTLPSIVADPALITQVLQNLIGNAVKFHRPGRPPCVHVSAFQRAGFWVFSVRDNGIGIQARHHQRIFRVFERLHTADEFPGTGVGLAIARRIVERHGGTVWFESQPGQGSTFCFSLPAADARTASMHAGSGGAS
jgi:PAS domain S-box-containing protein